MQKIIAVACFLFGAADKQKHIMKTVYLRNGEKCALHQELPTGEFLIEQYYDYPGHEGDYYEELSGVKTVVKEIFYSAPIEKIDEEYAKKENLLTQLNANVSELKSEESKLKYSIQNISKNIIDREKFIIDRSEFLKAKEIVVFIEGRLMPKRTKDSKYGFKISLSIEMRTGEQFAWYYSLYDHNDRFSYSDNVDKKYGMLYDPSEEEVEKIILEKLNSKEWDYTSLKTLPEKLITDEIRQKIAKGEQEEKEKSLKYIDAEMKKLEERREKLLNP